MPEASIHPHPLAAADLNERSTMTDEELIEEAIAWSEDDILPGDVQQLLRDLAARLLTL